MRDWSASRINQRVQSEQRRISQINRARRTPEQQQRLDTIRNIRQQEREQPTRRPQQLQTRQQRLEQFREWSRRRNFPENVRRAIADINMAAGNDPNDSYGYRVFYWRYVYGLPEVQAIRRVETRDT